MALAPADLQQVVDHIKINLNQMLIEAAPQFIAPTQLLERITRVEEALKNPSGPHAAVASRPPSLELQRLPP